MGIISWIRGKLSPVLGKVKSGFEGVGKWYDKAKNTYNSIKEKIASAPVIGTTASHLINKGEEALRNAVKDKTGVDLKTIDSGFGKARNIISNLPT
jgi:phage-related protein